jgi:hypothetical protein
VVTLRLEPIANIAAATADHEMIGLGVGTADDLYVLLLRSSGLVVSEREYSVLCVAPAGLGRTRISGNHPEFHMVQPLPGNRLILVGGRCRRGSAADIDRNARIFDYNGCFTGVEFTLGDGIEDVQTTEDGHLWVSYFDEGVLGGRGWGRRPVGESGLNRFTSAGERDYQYTPPPGLGGIVDCYALNIARNRTWFYYYPEFRLVRLNRTQAASWWHCPTHGGGAFAVEGDLVLMRGGYDEPSVCRLLRLRRDSTMDRLRLFEFTGVDGEVMDKANTRVAGRGKYLYLVQGTRVYRICPSEAV